MLVSVFIYISYILTLVGVLAVLIWSIQQFIKLYKDN